MKADPKDNKIVFLNRFNKYLFDKNSISMSLVKARIKKIIKDPKKLELRTKNHKCQIDFEPLLFIR